MRVMLACHNLPPEFTGGTERVVAVLAAELLAMGHDVEVFCGSERRAEQATIQPEQLGDVSVHRMVRASGHINPVDGHDPEVSALWDETLARFAPDVVHVHHWANLTDDLISVAARRGIPSVCTIHDFWTSCSLFFRLPDGETFCSESESPESCLPCLQRVHQMDPDELAFGFAMRREAYAQELSLSGAILFPGESHRDTYTETTDLDKAARSRMKVIALGAEDLPDVDVATPTKDGPIVMAHWGNLSGVKGLDILALAAAQSKSAGRLTLRLIGKAVEPGLFERLRGELGSVKLEAVGPYEVGSLPELLQGVSFAVFPSLARETHSLVLDEAMKMGFPVIVSDRGALPDRAGTRGLCTTAGSVDELADAIDRIVDPTTHQALVSGLPAGKLLSTRQHAEAVLASLAEVIENPPVFPSVIPDLGRTRLAFRNHRLDAIIHHVRGVNDHCARIVRAVAGDQGELKLLRETHPEIAETIEAHSSIVQDPES